jgi:hypothetical protein
VLIVFFYATLNSFTQVTINSNKLPVVGDLWTNKTISDTSIQPGPSGANQTWNFATFFVQPTVLSEQFVTPTGSGNDALFPAANLKVNSFFGGYDYYLKTSSDLQFLGTKSSISEIVITNSQKVLSTPLNYGDSIVNANVTGTGFGYGLSGTIKVKADGWGSLGLYTGSFANTMRVYTEMNLVLGAGTGIDTYILIQRYTWYSTQYKAPVFQISILDMNGPLGSAHQKVTTVSLLTTDIDDFANNAFSFFISPNPIRANTLVKIKVKQPTELLISVRDIIGKEWFRLQIDVNSGESKIPVDLSDLPKGVYIISASTGTEAKKLRVIKD